MTPYAIPKRFIFCLACPTFLLLGAACTATASEDQSAGVPAADRSAERDPAGFTAPRRPVTRQDYVDFVRPLAAGFEAGPNRGQYGPRHAFPTLAVFALEGQPELGAGIKQTLRHYADWVDQCVRTQHSVFSMEGATLCTFHFRELRKHGLMSAEDERWAKRCPIATRARAANVRIVDGRAVDSVALDGSPLRVGGKLRALIVDGFSNHDWQQTTAIVRRILEGTGRFEVSVSTSPPTKEAAGWDTWRPAFADADVVVLNCNSLDGRPTWPREVEVALEQYVRQGGGLYILHSANNSFAHWPEYDRMIGLGWRGKDAGYALTVGDDGRLTRIAPGEGGGTSHGPRVDAVIHVLGPHPIHAGYPRAWKTPQLEIYTYARGPAEELTVLSYVRDAQTGKNWPAEWVVRYGRGRVYNSTFGHVWAGDDNPVSTRCVGFRTTLIRAAEWLATGQTTWPVPADFPTADEVRLAAQP